VPSKTALIEIEPGRTPITGQIALAVANSKYLTTGKPAQIGARRGESLPTMADPVQWVKSEAEEAPTVFHEQFFRRHTRLAAGRLKFRSIAFNADSVCRTKPGPEPWQLDAPADRNTPKPSVAPNLALEFEAQLDELVSGQVKAPTTRARSRLQAWVLIELVSGGTPPGDTPIDRSTREPDQTQAGYRLVAEHDQLQVLQVDQSVTNRRAGQIAQRRQAKRALVRLRATIAELTFPSLKKFGTFIVVLNAHEKAPG
jgi:hypothetical protein